MPASLLPFPALRALWHKELDQHRRVLLALTALLATSYALALLALQRGERVVTLFELLPQLARLPLPAAAVLLGHRLVVSEYYGRTQRFLEALPVPRGYEALVKFGFGLACLSVWALVALAVTALLARAHEPVGPLFLGLLALRLAGYLFVLWAFAFLLGCCGRLRVPLLLVILMLVIALGRTSELTLSSFGPFALMDERTYAVERTVLPTRALLASFGLGTLFALIAFLLVRVREGAIMETLAKRLSTRETTAIVALVFGGLIAYNAAEKRKVSPMPALTTEHVIRVSTPAVKLEVGYFSDDLRAPAEELARNLRPALHELAAILPPPVQRLVIVHGGHLLPERPRIASRHAGLGLVVRANLRLVAPPAPRARHHAVQGIADLLHYYMSASAGERLQIERKHWLLDGYSLYLVTRAEDPALAARARTVILEAALAAAHLLGPGAPSAEHLAAYHTTAERLGEWPTAALAASGWLHLEAEAGPGAIAALARAAFGRRATGDVRDFLHERQYPIDRLFAAATGRDLPGFLARWQGWLTREAAGRAELLAQIPRPRIELQAARRRGLVLAGELAAPLPTAADCVVRHSLETWFDRLPDPELFDEERVPLAAGATRLAAALEADYERGERAFVALECSTAGLPWDMRLFATRATLP